MNCPDLFRLALQYYFMVMTRQSPALFVLLRHWAFHPLHGFLLGREFATQSSSLLWTRAVNRLMGALLLGNLHSYLYLGGLEISYSNVATA
jgi:hypothetical protein